MSSYILTRDERYVMDVKDKDSQRRKILADNIGRLRYEAGYSQQQFANMLGIQKAQLQRYEWNKHEPKLPLVYRMADRLRVDIRQLIMTEEEWNSIGEQTHGH